MKCLLAVCNATDIPARDTVVAWLKIHTNYTPHLRDFGIGADSGLVWMKNLHNNIIPCGQPMIDGAITKYGFVKKKFLAYPAIRWHIVVFDAGYNINTLPLGVKFTYSVPRVYFAGEHENAWDGSDIEDSVNQNFIELKYSYKWGDCIDGCDNEHYWIFRVYNDCSVEYRGTYGNQLPVWASIQKNNHALFDVKIYPNPAKDRIYVDATESDIVSLNIFDVVGAEVTRFEIKNRKTEIDVSNLAKGIYIVSVQSKTGQKQYKILKD